MPRQTIMNTMGMRHRFMFLFPEDYQASNTCLAPMAMPLCVWRTQNVYINIARQICGSPSLLPNIESLRLWPAGRRT